MKLLTFIYDGIQQVGFLSSDEKTVYSLHKKYASMQDLIERYNRAELESLSGDGIDITQVTLCAPIPNPRHDLLCIGHNYIEHVVESAKFLGREYEKPLYPVYFTKRVHETVASGAMIPSHADITRELDYECELAVVIGKACSHVAKEEAYRHIFGYTIVNDVSAREVQRNHMQFMFGKSLDGFAPMGPWIVTADEIGAPPELDVRTRVNSELRQDSNTRNFIFDIPELISRLSAGITLYPGDILVTGTPSGVGAGFTPPRFLRPGDVVECEIEGIGILRNTVG